MGNCAGMNAGDSDVDPYAERNMAELDEYRGLHLVRGSSLTYDSVNRIMSNDSVNTDGGGPDPFYGLSSKKYDEFIKRKLNSEIYLEVNFYTKVPEKM